LYPSGGPLRAAPGSGNLGPSDGTILSSASVWVYAARMPDNQAPRGEADGVPHEATAVRPEAPREAGPAHEGVRFTPGTMLAGRYRIVALLGRGGMGEVYRAEDTKLGQQVALKFLPATFARDPHKLERLYDEVRLGRQVSHPNVCRMYDIAEWEGHHFMSMEYIDGEDLASLLRRIGKLPHAKALDIARDLCAGLAAAHALAIVHRDLKPANVMIDGRGDARITDFGLAALAEDLEERREIAGTPAYMAPEQLEGGEVTQKTDLYALGLIFYEMFTGKRRFEGGSFGELLSQHKSSGSQSLSRETGDLDPAVQRVIVRCLEEEQAKRPASIHSVIAALPGGDPLQAALEAGETPSPEMIAAAGSTGELRPSVGWPLLILTVLVLLAVAAISPRVRLYGQVELPLEPVELKVKARALLAGAGLAAKPVDVAYEMGVDADYRVWKREQNRAGAKPAEPAEHVFSPVIFGYRESPTSMRVAGRQRVSGFGSIPALEVAGMGQVVLEPDGRLRRLVVVTPDEQTAIAVRPEWESLFNAAGLKAGEARATAPVWRPPVGSDARFAWLVPVPGLATPVRVEAASLSGHRVWFEVITPWKRPVTPVLHSASGEFARSAFLSVILASMVISILLAHRNLRRGRGDRSGAFRLALVVFAASLGGEILYTDHYRAARQETPAILNMITFSTFAAMVIWIWYLALEPYLRRRWPGTLIGWSRLVQGRWLDPLVGRSILLGVLAGGVAKFVEWTLLAAPSWLGWTPPVPWDATLLEITGWGYVLGNVSYVLRDGIMLAPALMVLLLILHLLLRRRGFAVAAMFVLLVVTRNLENYAALEWSGRVLVAGVVLWVMVRYGLLALAAFEFTRLLIGALPLTLDPAAWYFDHSLLGLAILMGLAVFGFYRSLGSHALFAEPVLEE
jgi:hypothetical protein